MNTDHRLQKKIYIIMSFGTLMTFSRRQWRKQDVKEKCQIQTSSIKRFIHLDHKGGFLVFICNLFHLLAINYMVYGAEVAVLCMKSTTSNWVESMARVLNSYNMITYGRQALKPIRARFLINEKSEALDIREKAPGWEKSRVLLLR